jgi:hypothetical protein
MVSMPPLSVEQRSALDMLASAGRNGAPQALLSAHGFDASMIAGLVNHGLATLTAEKGPGRRKAASEVGASDH